jgi:intracellular sulfur oxidation DsrE/DsrF family protein
LAHGREFLRVRRSTLALHKLQQTKWVHNCACLSGQNEVPGPPAKPKNARKVLMFKSRWFLTLSVTCLFISVHPVSGQAPAEHSLQIDVPVKLEKANVVVDIGHAVFVGDMPFVFGDINLLAGDLNDWNVKGQIVTVLHGDAAYFILNDEAYNANRHVTTGNPYAKLIAGWMKQGVQVELCGATAKANHWGNADLIPGVKVNTNAMVRVTQLEQQGYTLIYE